MSLPNPKGLTNQVEEVRYPDKNMGEFKSRGLALIVSMESGRPGGDVDRRKQAELFAACRYKVQEYVDLKASELFKMMKSVAESGILEKCDSFICSINGHGSTHDDGQLYIIDEEKVKVMVMQHIIEPFRQSKHLFNKPKIFFVICCRGMKLYDVNRVMEEANPVSHDDHDAAQDAHDDQLRTGSLRPHLEELSDCLLVFSTSEGSPSCRNPKTGTIFVENLVGTVTEERETTDVLSMMTIVNDKVNNVQNFAMVDGTKVKVGQCCEVRSSLRKKLYWKTGPLQARMELGLDIVNNSEKQLEKVKARCRSRGLDLCAAISTETGVRRAMWKLLLYANNFVEAKAEVSRSGARDLAQDLELDLHNLCGAQSMH